MAKTGETDDSFIREVDEEYRKARLASFWGRYGRWLVVGVVVLLGGLAAYLWWQAERARAAGVAGEDFSLALAKLETGNAPDAKPILDRLATGDRPGFAVLAKLTQAANAVVAGDTARAVTMYSAIAADTAQPQPIRELALVKTTRLEFETLPPATIIARLRPLSAPGNPWFGIAGEMVAVAYLRSNQPQLAGTLLADIARDASLPPSMRGRAQQLAGSLGIETGPLGLTPGAR